MRERRGIGGRRLRTALVSVVAAASAVAAFAAQGWRLAEVRVTGSQEYTREEIVRASGLEKGTSVTAEDLRDASRKLVASGAFAHVAYQYQTVADNVTVDFEIQDAEAYLPIQYENFVWAKEGELQAFLQKRIPLFHGRVTRSETLLKTIETALGEWLSAHEVHATVVAQLHASVDGMKVDAASFAVQGIPMPVKELQWVGAAHLDAADRAEVEKLIVGHPYESTAVQAAIKMTVARSYARKGLLKAKVGEPEVRLSGAVTSAPDVVVVVPVSEGAVYTVGDVEWKDTEGIETAGKVRAKRGAPLDGAQLEEDLAQVRDGLVSKGYFQAKITAAPRYHDDTSTVDYILTLERGPVFRMGTLTFEGVSEAARERLTKRWKLKPGDPFDPNYMKGFVRENADPALGRTVKTHATPVEGNLVNVVLQYQP